MHNAASFADFPLYDRRTEHDACGIGFVVNLGGEKTHEIIAKGIEVLVNLAHRGACGCDPETGDGAGVTIQIPHAFFARECQQLGFNLPGEGEYGVGMVFLPSSRNPASSARQDQIALFRKRGSVFLDGVTLQ